MTYTFDEYSLFQLPILIHVTLPRKHRNNNRPFQPGASSFGRALLSSCSVCFQLDDTDADDDDDDDVDDDADVDCDAEAEV